MECLFKLLSYMRPDGSERWDLITNDDIIDLQHIAPTLQEAMRHKGLPTQVLALAPQFPIEGITFLPVIPNLKKLDA